jgi:zinc resistance-associated protein
MTRKNLSITTLAMILTLAMAGLAVAGPGYGPGNGRGGCGGWGGQAGPQGWYGQLTQEKQAAVQNIFESYRPKFDEVRTSLRAKHNVLQAMINGGQADEQKITKLTKDISDLRDKMFDLRQAMNQDLSKETGLNVSQMGRGFGPGQGRNFNCAGPGYGRGDCPGYGQGYGQGYGHGRGMKGGSPRWQ